MLLGLKDRFIPMVEDGTKRHTIRAGERWAAGMRADLYRESRRQKKYDAEGRQIAGMRLIFRAPVVKVHSITIRRNVDCLAQVAPLAVWIEDNRLSDDEADALFYTDGFRNEGAGERYPSMYQAFEFWRATLVKKPFTGQIIYFDSDRREVK